MSQLPPGYVREFESELPWQCPTCQEVFWGREISYMPIMCEQAQCPGVPPQGRLRATVRVVDVLKDDSGAAAPEHTDTRDA